MYTTQDTIMIGGAIAIAALVQGYGGFGYGIVCMALLALMPFEMFDMSVTITLVAAVVMVLLLVISGRDHGVRWRDGLLITLGAIVGIPLGHYFIVTFGNQPIFRIALGIFLVVVGANGVLSHGSQRELPESARIPAGIASGFLAGAFVTGGPPVILYLYSKTKDPREMKATVQFIFVSILSIRLVLIAFFGKGYTPEIVTLAAWIAPVCVPFLLLGHVLSKRGSARTFKTVVYALIAISGISLVIKASL